jgi:hypothetical protein
MKMKIMSHPSICLSVNPCFVKSFKGQFKPVGQSAMAKQINTGIFYYRNKYFNKCVRFEVLTAVSTKIAVFWVVALCSLVEVYQRFKGPCWLHHHGNDGGSKDL